MKSLLTDPGVIEVDQHSMEGHLLGRMGMLVAWAAVSENRVQKLSGAVQSGGWSGACGQGRLRSMVLWTARSIR